MAKYKVSFNKSVAKEFRTISKKDVAKILHKINSLLDEPRVEGSAELTGQDFYRVRQGLYRIIYEICDEQLLIYVIKVAHRSNVSRSK